MTARRTIASFAILALASEAQAEVRLPDVISDHMVLQAGMDAPVFGTAEPGEEVTVDFNGQKKGEKAGKDGKWVVKLDPLKAGGPFEMKIGGTNALTVKDVLVGEVWIAGGQSNMRFPLSKATDGAADIAKADRPKLRFLPPGGKWQVCTPKTAPAFSAVGYYFALALADARKVPVGVIDNSVNGELAQNFVSREAFTAGAELAGMVKRHAKETSSQWDKLVVPLIPFGIRGVVWAQGEGNSDFPVTYRRLLPALVGDWRGHWGRGDFPFVVVQLANYQDRREAIYEDKYCALREAQLKAVQATPKTALVVTIDIGIAKDVHFPNKKPVGERLALAARALAYDEKIVASGPIFEAAKFEGGHGRGFLLAGRRRVCHEGGRRAGNRLRSLRRG